MGFCSWVVNKCKKAYNYVKEKVTSGIRTVRQACTNVVNRITGKDKFEEAKRLYNSLRERYEQKKSEYERQMGVLESDITALTNRVNDLKAFIVQKLFAKMASILTKIKYEQRFCVEVMQLPQLKIETMRSQATLFLIDFDKDPIKSTLKAIVSLGFWTRKQATETLDRVKEEEKKLEDIFCRMNAELTRCNLIKLALQNTVDYLEKMISIYKLVLCKAEHAANYLRFKCIQFTHSVSERYCQLKSLPKADQTVLMALFLLTKILNDISKMQLISDSKEKVEKYNQEIVNGYTDFMSIKVA